jgi:cellulose biosynthesis protein BcsQ
LYEGRWYPVRSIVVFNNKGGVGKTTLLCNLAAYFSLVQNKKVLVVDADPQCNATVYSLPEPEVERLYSTRTGSTIDEFFDPLRRGKGYFTSRFVATPSPRFGFDLIPGDPRLALSEDLLASDWSTGSSGDPRGLQTTLVFRDLLLRFKEYDYAFLDVGPSLGAINRSVLLASDFFLMPMSSDIFSVMAISNISASLKKWKRGLLKGLEDYRNEEGNPYRLGTEKVTWNLRFLGYISQQYTAKSVRGVRQAVSAYERIIARAPSLIQRNLVANFPARGKSIVYHIGDIPNLHSVVPLSQTAHAPIFRLKGGDGVVGAHFAKVRDTEEIYKGIVQRVATNVRGR